MLLRISVLILVAFFALKAQTLSAVAQSPTQINLAWNSTAPANYTPNYTLSRCVGSSCAVLVAGTTANSYSDTGLTPGTSYTYQLATTVPLLTATASTPTAAPATSTSIWPSTAVPSLIDSGDSQAVELGVRFQSSVAGVITGLRFYKASANTGVHTGHLWSDSGTPLGSLTFTGETASGWQQTSFQTPVPIAANTNYVASYFAPKGRYSADSGYFAKATISPPLTALQNVSTSVNGPFHYGSTSAFPTAVYQSSNYWVDVVFTPTGTAGSPPVHSVSLSWAAPASGTIAGYNVYRAAVSGGPYSRLNPAMVVTTAYADSAVTAGTTYYYVATSVDSGNNESSYSNQVTTTVPSP